MDKPDRSGKTLSAFALKYIAMVSMLCDHIAFLVIRRGLYAPFTSPDGGISFSDAPAWLRTAETAYHILDVLGHAAFPIFIFLLTEGFLHTRSKKRYLLTLLAFAVVTEPIFDFAHYGELWNYALQNVLFTLAVSCGELWGIEAVQKRLTKPAQMWAAIAGVILAAAGIAFLLRGEYVFLGTSAAALFYLLREKNYWRFLGLAPLLAASPWVLLALPVLLLYNGRRGMRGSKYFFYIFYPAHFLLLTGIGALCARLPG